MSHSKKSTTKRNINFIIFEMMKETKFDLFIKFNRILFFIIIFKNSKLKKTQHKRIFLQWYIIFCWNYRAGRVRVMTRKLGYVVLTAWLESFIHKTNFVCSCKKITIFYNIIFSLIHNFHPNWIWCVRTFLSRALFYRVVRK